MADDELIEELKNIRLSIGNLKDAVIHVNNRLATMIFFQGIWTIFILILTFLILRNLKMI